MVSKDGPELGVHASLYPVVVSTTVKTTNFAIAL